MGKRMVCREVDGDRGRGWGMGREKEKVESHVLKEGGVEIG